MEFILKVLAVFGLSFFKFLAGGAVAFASLNPVEGFISVLLGSSASALFFTYGGSAWLEFIRRRRKKNPVKLFTKWNRFLVKLKKNGGLPVIALISPIVISIPVGCLVALTFIHDKSKIASFMIASAFIWSFLLFGFKSLLPQILHW